MIASKRNLRLLVATSILILFFSGLSMAKEAGSMVNINTASVKELQQIKGVGKTLAERIVAYREEAGPFKEAKEITKVKGVGKGTFEKIKDQISVGEKTAEAAAKTE